MANDLTDDPLYLDTSDASNVVVQGRRYIYAIKFFGATTANHKAALTVKAGGRVFWSSSAVGNGDQSFDILRIRTPGDLVLSTLGSGVVLVYLGPER